MKPSDKVRRIEDQLAPSISRSNVEIFAMSSFPNKAAFVTGDSRALIHATAHVLANEFGHVFVLDDPAVTGSEDDGARSDVETIALHLDTYGRPLRDWDD